jgi:hypothetical protein
MQLKKLGNNETQVTQPNGYLVLYSYNTPVCVRHLSSHQEWYTTKKWSSTTSKHINKWKSDTAIAVTQETLEKIIAVGYNEALDR